jgi:agmatinase
MTTENARDADVIYADDIVDVDLFEVSPPYDPYGATSLLAARTNIDFIGSIFRVRTRRRV